MSSARTRRFLRFVPAILFAITATACVTAETMPSASVTTIDPAATRWFQLEWTTTPVVGTNTQNVDVWVFNTYGEAARVQLLAQGLDASGQLVDQKIDYPEAPVGGYGRSYFRIGPLAAADHYRVTVWSGDFFQAPRIIR
jgi:hypothetical protein